MTYPTRNPKGTDPMTRDMDDEPQTATPTRFADEREPWYPADWVGGVSYSLRDTATGRKVLGCWSAGARRYLLPGEMVHVCDAWGYWRARPAVMLIGRNGERSDWLVYYADEAGDRAADSHGITDIIPATAEATR